MIWLSMISLGLAIAVIMALVAVHYVSRRVDFLTRRVDILVSRVDVVEKAARLRGIDGEG